jgi:hypothetical protein
VIEENYLKNGRFYFWKEKFAIVKSKRVLRNAFAVVKDRNEITVIIEQSKLNKKDMIEMEKDYRIITFDMTLPFGLVGFLSRISKALADQNISILTVSAYSTDHILVKEKDLPSAIRTLGKIGFITESK